MTKIWGTRHVKTFLDTKIIHAIIAAGFTCPYHCFGGNSSPLQFQRLEDFQMHTNLFTLSEFHLCIMLFVLIKYSWIRCICSKMQITLESVAIVGDDSSLARLTWTIYSIWLACLLCKSLIIFKLRSSYLICRAKIAKRSTLQSKCYIVKVKWRKTLHSLFFFR